MAAALVAAVATGPLVPPTAAAPVADDPPAKKCSPEPPLGWWESADLGPLFTKPNGPAPTTDCDFHVWSWTAFLHWTQIDPKTKQPRFLGLHTPADLNPLTRLAPGTRSLVLRPRTTKPNDVTDIQQAGPQGVIVDQHGRAAYYSVHLDQPYFDTTDKFYGPLKYQAATPTDTYPIGATVFKAAWRVVQPGEDPKGVFVTKAAIAKLVNGSDGHVKASGELIPDVPVALVGLHVVGTIKEHPEFAWGTFEHDGETPELPPKLNPADPVSDKSFRFYKAGTAAKDCNLLAQGKAVKVIDEKAQTLAPVTNVYLQFPQGGAAPDRAADIVAVNKVFRAGVVAHKNVNPVWANYRLIGTVWEKPNSLKPGDGAMDKAAVGSVSLANSLMETYVQGAGTNCFSCHNTGAGPKGKDGKPLYPGKDINLSHTLLAPFFSTP